MNLSLNTTCIRRVVSICLVLAVSASAQTPQLLKDINTQLSPNPSSKAGPFVQLGSKTIFAATRSDVGNELWISDGSSKGTTLLKDILKGRGSSGPSQFLRVGSLVFFTASDIGNGRELWKSDGTSKGTVLVRDLSPGASSTVFEPLHLLGNRTVFLTKGTFTQQPSLWSSDGTSQGTLRILSTPKPRAACAELVTAGANAYFCTDGTLYRTDGTKNGTLTLLSKVALRAAMPFGNLLLFVVSANGTDSLWRTDGTTAGTRSLASLLASGARYLVPKATNRFLFFSRTNGAQMELWRSDATAAGTIRFASFATTQFWQAATVAGSKLFFTIDKEAWVSDGFSAGTKRLGVFSDSPFDWATLGNVAFFSAAGPTNGRELWRSDGTSKGTREVLDIRLGPLGSSPGKLTRIGKLLYFTADLGLSGREPWRSDGTPSGTFLLRDIRPGRSGSFPVAYFAAGSKAIFTAFDDRIGFEPWISDGTAAGTRLLLDLNPQSGTRSSQPNILGRINGLLIIAADDGIRGKELWASDGSAEGTVLVADIKAGPEGSNPTPIASLDNVLFFGADDGVHGTEVWKTDGSVRGTSLVKDIMPGALGSFVLGGTRHGQEVFFNAYSQSKNRQDYRLWKTNGTNAGTVEFFSNSARYMTSVGPKLFFVSTGGLYVSDGTSKGTKLLWATWFLGPTFRTAMTELNGELYFAVESRPPNSTIWKTDGSAKGTVRLHPISFAPVDNLVTVGASVFFHSRTTFVPGRLYRTNGSVNGLQIVSTKFQPSGNVAVLGDKLIFNAFSTSTGYGLWITDGTGAGTKQLAPITAFVQTNIAERVGSRRAYFGAQLDFQRTSALMVTDGTSSGTKAVKDLHTGSSQTILFNGKLIFAADDPEIGRELWVLDPGATTQSLGLACSTQMSSPTLDGSDPVLGGNMLLKGKNASGNAGLLLLSTRSVPSLSISASCTTALAPANLMILGTFPVTNGTWTVPMFIPNLKSLIGLQVVLQALHPNSSSALGFDLSNGLLLSLGN